MNEDFTEEEEFDELPEGIEFAEPAQKQPLPASPQRAPAPASAPQQRAPAPQRMETRGRPRKTAPAPAPVQPAAEEAPRERYIPYVMEKKVGVHDNETNQPLMEDAETNTLLLGLMTKLLNDVDDIKKNI